MYDCNEVHMYGIDMDAWKVGGSMLMFANCASRILKPLHCMSFRC